MKRIKREDKERVIGIMSKAGSEEYETSWDEKGIPTYKKKSEVKKGKKSRARGARFETKVREHLEGMGWIVSKWMNTVDYNKLKIVPAKRKYNPFLKVLGIGTGFPDFVCFKRTEDKNYEVIGVEVKIRGYLDKIEKGMCQWLLQSKTFSRILIARRGGKRGEIEYVDFIKKYGLESNKT